MSATQLTSFLGLLRLIKRSNADNTPGALVSQWTGMQNPPTSMVVKLASYVIEQAEATEAYINGRQLSEEAKQGLLQTTSSLKRAFELPHLSGNSVSGFLPALDAAISQYAILISAAGLDQAAVRPDEADDLVADLDKFVATLSEAQLDPAVQEVARKHIAVLKALLQNVEAFGVEAALATYAEMVIRLRAADRGTSADSKQSLAKVWPEIERWAGRLVIIDGIYTQGAHLVEGASSAFKALLPLLPTIPG